MRFKRGEIAMAVFTLLYLLIFFIFYSKIKHYEFLWYIFVVLFFFALIFLTLRRTNLDYYVLGGLSLWGLLHMLGGGVRIGGEVLYALQIIPIINSGEIVILKFDQFVHFFGFGVTTLLAYNLLKGYLNDKVNYKIFYPALVLVGMGLGALNEIIEFAAVVSVPETGVGGYFNTALDLVFNMLGAIAAVFLIH